MNNGANDRRNEDEKNFFISFCQVKVNLFTPKYLRLFFMFLNHWIDCPVGLREPRQKAAFTKSIQNTDISMK